MGQPPNEEIVQKTINDLQRKIKDAYLVDDFGAMNDLNGRMLKIASQLTNPKHVQSVSEYHQNVSRILKQRQLYASMITQITDIFRPQRTATKNVDDNSLRLQLLEREFQNAFIDRNFRFCLDKIPEILDLSRKLKMQGKIDTYLQVTEYLERAAPPKKELVAPVQEAGGQAPIPAAPVQKMSSPKPVPVVPIKKTSKTEPLPPIPKEVLRKIEDLKKTAMELEGRLEFQQAKGIYQEMMQVATTIGDRLTMALCDQMIAQIGVWVEEIENSDFTTFEIPPFRLINRARFDCLEALSDKGAANKKMENLISLGVKPENIKVITVSRTKFKGKSPYNKSGEIFALYIRRSFD